MKINVRDSHVAHARERLARDGFGIIELPVIERMIEDFVAHMLASPQLRTVYATFVEAERALEVKRDR